LKKLGIILYISFIISLIVVPFAFCQSIESLINQSEPATNSKNPAVSSSLSEKGPADTGNEAYAIQIGTFRLENDANKQVIELKNQGLKPYIFQSVNSKGQTIFAVRIGNFGSIDEAKASLAKIKEKIDIPVFITKYNSLEPVTAKSAPTAVAAKTEKTPAPPPESITRQAHENGEKSIDKRLKSLEEQIRKLKEEADLRRKLSASAEEKKASETSEDILEAAGREYTLTREGNLKFSYSLSYSYSNYDALRAATRVEEVANHTISNSFSVSYGLKDNFNISTGIPFVYKYTNVGTVNSRDTTGIGDLSFNWSWQPVKPSAKIPTIIVNGGFVIPSGRSPYDINVEKDLSTGSGIYSTNLGISLSRVTDPVVVFTSLSASYPFSVTDINQKRTEGILDKVDPGMGIGFGCGMGYSLSYRLYINMSFSYSYNFETKYYYKNAPSAKSGTYTSASLRLGVGYKYSPAQNLNFSLGIPLTSNNGFSFSFSTPIEFKM